MRKALPLFVLTAALALHVQAMDFNADIMNLGPATAYDIAIVLEGWEQIDDTYDGDSAPYDKYHFRTFTKSYNGLSTVLHWEHPYDETASPPAPRSIPPGAEIHVGYSTPDDTSKVIDMYWTDAWGGRIFGGGIAITGGHIDVAGVTFHNSLSSRLSISNLRYATPNVPLRLDALNRWNSGLMQTLRPLPGPGGITLAPGQTIFVPFPQQILPGQPVIVVYDTTGPVAEDAGAARSVVFVQDIPLLQQ